MTEDIARLSKRLSWLLRHGAGEVGLEMDAAGWSTIADVLAIVGMTRRQLDAAVERNDKGRLQVDGLRIRACQGHSLDGMPVSREALEASWERLVPGTPLWHGTGTGAIAGIAERGIEPGKRSHVHLAPRADSRVGKRSAVDLLLEVSPQRLTTRGIDIFEAPNGVVLVRSVPTACITAVHARSRRGKEHADEARRRLALG